MLSFTIFAREIDAVEDEITSESREMRELSRKARDDDHNFLSDMTYDEMNELTDKLGWDRSHEITEI